MKHFQRGGGLEKNPFCGGGLDIFWYYTIELKGQTIITSGNESMWKPRSSNTLKTLGKIWKVKLLLKPVGRAANTSFLRTTILVPRAYDPSGLRQESRALEATISGMRHRCRLRSETRWAKFGYFLCYFKMVAPRALDSCRRPEGS